MWGRGAQPGAGCPHRGFGKGEPWGGLAEGLPGLSRSSCCSSPPAAGMGALGAAALHAGTGFFGIKAARLYFPPPGGRVSNARCNGN